MVLVVLGWQKRILCTGSMVKVHRALKIGAEYNCKQEDLLGDNYGVQFAPFVSMPMGRTGMNETAYPAAAHQAAV